MQQTLYSLVSFSANRIGPTKLYKLWGFTGTPVQLRYGGECRSHDSNIMKFWKAGLWVFFLLFRAALVAYVSSQAAGGAGATAAGLHHSHSNMGSELHL